MEWHEFLFSDKRNHRITRHIVFWLVWWLYFAATYYYYLQVGLQKINFGNLSAILLAKSFVLVLVHLLASYIFIYIILPRFLLKAKYLLLTVSIILLSISLVAAGYFIQQYVFVFLDTTFNFKQKAFNNTVWWTSINSVLLNAPKVIIAATAIKLAKIWYNKQKEKEQLEKEKLNADLQLLKAQIHPRFLFNSLDHIYAYAEKDPPIAQNLLLQLSDILSYMLYECDQLNVPLQNDLNIMKNYMALEKSRYGGSLELEMEIKGDSKNRFIAPLLLLPFIENSFSHCNNQTEQPWINLEIGIQNDILTMKLMHCIDLNVDSITSHEFLNVQKRLQLLYPGNHELRRFVEEEIYVVLLKVNIAEKPVSPIMEPGEVLQQSKTIYAIG